jgi:hypothetical protein
LELYISVRNSGYVQEEKERSLKVNGEVMENINQLLEAEEINPSPKTLKFLNHTLGKD